MGAKEGIVYIEIDDGKITRIILKKEERSLNECNEGEQAILV